MTPVRIWDLPTRLFHWLLATSFVAAWISSGSDRWLSVHSFVGYVLLGLVCFRFVWGLVGGPYARFASFAYGPAAVLDYLRHLRARTSTRYLGHNPAGSVAIYLMLALGLAVGLTGVFTQGGEEQQLVAAHVLSIPTGTLVRQAHELLAWSMLAVVAGHLCGVLADAWMTRENLPLSMVTGLKEAAPGTLASARYAPVGGLMLLAIAAFAAWWFAYAWRSPPVLRAAQASAAATSPAVAFIGRRLPDDPTWREECGSCHLAFHPNLLPQRSWERLMTEQDTHFGTDLALAPATANRVRAFLVANAAEHSRTEAAFKINRSVPAGSTPLRITATPYWISKHASIDAEVWARPSVKGKANCAACHVDAEAGAFEDSAMRIPSSP
jgi:cytochrome b